MQVGIHPDIRNSRVANPTYKLDSNRGLADYDPNVFEEVRIS